jgi:hypothetical protein
MIKLTVKKTPWITYSMILADREPFKTGGSLYATATPGWRFGRLDYEYRDSFKRADYAVYSYSTPIAWHGPDGWTMPDVKYSPTTSQHQSKIFFVKDWEQEGVA